ncbi:MAG TPA: GNAT family N-acetyltransferase [Propionibacteriaceae bacterium]
MLDRPDVRTSPTAPVSGAGTADPAPSAGSSLVTDAPASVLGRTDAVAGAADLPGRAQLDWRPLTAADLVDLDVLLTVIEEADDPGKVHSLAELQQTFAADAEVSLHSRLGRTAEGVLVAYGWNHPLPLDSGPCRVHLSGGVHPEHRGQGFGHVLLRWQLEAARSWHGLTHRAAEPLWSLVYLEGHRPDQQHLYEDLGLRGVRWYADMTRTLSPPLPQHEDPPGIRVVPLNRKRFEAVRLAHNEVFAEHWDSQPIDPSGWEKQLVRPQSRLSWSWVALAAETSEVVGYATNAAYEEDWADQGFSEGWTDRLGVRRAWRGRGVARALLTATLRSFSEAGLDAAGLGVDSDDPAHAFDLYHELGYHSTHSVVMFARTVAGVSESEPDPDGARPG